MIKVTSINIIQLFVIFLACFMPVNGQRTQVTINNTWLFKKGAVSLESAMHDTTGWELINLPHTWNIDDVTDEDPGYYRGPGWYRKTLYLDTTSVRKEIYLHFEGSNQVTDVYVNGVLAGTHTGGYTAFLIPVSPYMKMAGKNGKFPQDILIRVTNAHNEDIPPLSADFTFYGGIYRDVSLLSLPLVHFDHGETASPGVFISTPHVDSLMADVMISGNVSNKKAQKAQITLRSRLINPEGTEIAVKESWFDLSPGSIVPFEHLISGIPDPSLWSTDHPRLYQVVSEIYDARTKKLIDQLIHPLGLRYYEFDPEIGFILNGSPLKLIGVNRHQDFQGFGNAVPDEVHLKDMELMKEMGINFLRIAHYPQDHHILHLCDRMGILTSVEIPIVNRITETEAFFENCLVMQKEMIHQYYNHPSVIIWAYMNEVLLRPRYRDEPKQYETYIENIQLLAEKIESLTRKEDPYRYTMIPNHGSIGRYTEARLTEIPMLVGWNLYQGWYDRDIEGFGRFLDKHRAILPHKPLLVTEYGGGADARIRSEAPVRFDFSVEYNNFLHKTYLDEMLSRPFVAAAMVWNFADFNSEGRIDAVPHMNNKGITEWNRKPKDTYYLYQAYLKKDPFVAIGSRQWKYREGLEDANRPGICTRLLDVYSNCDSVSLILNGTSCFSNEKDGPVTRFSVPFNSGDNQLIAKGFKDGDSISDFLTVRFHVHPYILTDKEQFLTLNISVGDRRTINDEENGICWIPDKPHTPGGWGYIGGSLYALPGSGRQAYGTDLAIKGTQYDPVFQTQRCGINAYRFDVPDGLYEIVLHFADLEPAHRDEPLPYNLFSGDYQGKTKEREFSVNVNNQPLLNSISNQAELIPGRAFSSKTEVYVSDDSGIVVEFVPSRGETILNAIQLRKIF